MLISIDIITRKRHTYSLSHSLSCQWEGEFKKKMVEYNTVNLRTCWEFYFGSGRGGEGVRGRGGEG